MRGSLGQGTGISIEIAVPQEARAHYVVMVGAGSARRLADTTRPQGVDLPPGTYLVHVAAQRAWDVSNKLSVEVAEGRRVALRLTLATRPGWTERSGAGETLRLEFTDDAPAPLPALPRREVARVQVPAGGLAHVELWTSRLSEVGAGFGWLFGELGWDPEDVRAWPAGYVWRHPSGLRIRLEESAESGSTHDRFRPGLNHLAFRVDPADLPRLREAAPRHGWTVEPVTAPVGAKPQDSGPRVRLENTQGFAVDLLT